MIDVTVLRALAAAGASADMIVAAVEAAQVLEAEKVAAKRARDADRQRRKREREAAESHDASRDVTLCHADTDGRPVTSRDPSFPPSPPSSSPPTPSLITTPSPSIPPTASLRSAGPRNRGTRLPADFNPTMDDWDFAIGAVGIDRACRELAKFRDHWLAKPGQAGTKINWDATWRNWVRGDVDRRGAANGPRRQSLSDLAADLAEQARSREREAGIGGPPDPVGGH